MSAVNSIINASLPDQALPRRDGIDGPVPGGTEMSFSDLWQDKDSLGFADFLDLVNPLQHIPVVSTIYRAITGDEIGTAARFAGSALFAGPIGLAGAVLTAVAEEIGGDSLENQIASLFGGGNDTAGPATEPRIAGAAPQPPVPAPKAVSRTNPETVETARPDDETDNQRARIAASIEAARRAQADLLLSRLGLDPKDPGGQAYGTILEHPNFLSPGSNPQAIGRNMSAALELYRRSSRLSR